MGRLLTKDFVESRDVLDRPELELLGGLVVDPEALAVVLDTADVGVGTEEDVLELRLLLVGLFDCFLAGAHLSSNLLFKLLRARLYSITL